MGADGLEPTFEQCLEELAENSGLPAPELHSAVIAELKYIIEQLAAKNYARLAIEGRVEPASSPQGDPEGFAIWLKDYDANIVPMTEMELEKYALFPYYKEVIVGDEVGSIDLDLKDDQGWDEMTLRASIHIIDFRPFLQIQDIHVL